MIITCPACSKTYKIKDGSISPEGRKVRCASCRETWTAGPDGETMAAPVAVAASKPKAPVEPDMTTEGGFDEETRAIADDWSQGVDDEAEADRADEDRSQAQDEDDEDWPDDDLPVDDDANRTAVQVAMAVAQAAARPAAEGSSEMGDEDDHAITDDDLDAAYEEMAGQAANRQGKTIEGELGRVTPFLGALKRIRPKKKSGHAIEGFGWPNAAQNKVRRLAMSSGIAACLLLASLGTAILGRNMLTGWFPDLASLYAVAGFQTNVRGLVLEQVTASEELRNGVPTLVVKGRIRNVTGGERIVPAIRVALMARNDVELHAWSYEPEARLMMPEYSASFETLLEAPPGNATRIVAQFMERPQ